MKKTIFRILTITIGTILYSASISLFLEPNQIAPGGLSGFSIILSHIILIPTGTIFFFLNIPLLFIGSKKFGKSFLISTLYCTTISSFFMNFFSLFSPITLDVGLSAFFGPILIAVGLGLILKAGATSGGMDIIVKLLRLKFPHLRTGFLLFVLDFIVVCFSILVFKNIDIGLYAILSIFITSYVLDFVLYGKDSAKMILIISNDSCKIAQRLMKELYVGTTYLDGEGAYNNKKKKLILCVMRKSLSYKAEEIVKEIDPESFMIVMNATEIYGKGYKSYFGNKL